MTPAGGFLEREIFKANGDVDRYALWLALQSGKIRHLLFQKRRDPMTYKELRCAAGA